MVGASEGRTGGGWEGSGAVEPRHKRSTNVIPAENGTFCLVAARQWMPMPTRRPVVVEGARAVACENQKKTREQETGKCCGTEKKRTRSCRMPADMERRARPNIGASLRGLRCGMHILSSVPLPPANR